MLNLSFTYDSLCSYTITNSFIPYDTATVGVEEIKGEINTLNIFPNPVIEELSFNYTFTKNKTAYLEIYNVLSQKIKTEQLKANAQTHRINVSEFSQGIYYCRLIADGKKEAAGRFLKE